MTYRILIEIYLIYSAFCVGNQFEELRDDYEGWKRIAAFCLFFILLPFGHIYSGLQWVWGRIEAYTAITFWYKYHFTKEWDSLQPHQLRRHQNIIKNHRNTNSLRHRYWRYCVSKIFERNNYNPDQDVDMGLES